MGLIALFAVSNPDAIVYVPFAPFIQVGGVVSWEEVSWEEGGRGGDGWDTSGG